MLHKILSYKLKMSIFWLKWAFSRRAP